MIYLSNGFSVSMVRFPLIGDGREIYMTRISAKEAGELLRGNSFRSVYGHLDSAWHLGRYLKIRILVCREAISLEQGDVLIVAKATLDREYKLGIRRAPKWSFFRIELTGEKGGDVFQ